MLLYLGNFLAHKDLNPTYSFALAQKLSERYTVHTVGTALSRGLRLAQMMRAVLTKNPKAILLDGYATRAFWYLVLLTPLIRLRGIPCILILHSGRWPERINRNRGWAFFVFRRVAKIVCTSEYLYHAHHWPMMREKSMVIHNFGEVRSPGTVRTGYAGRILWVREYQPRYGDEDVLHLGLLLKKMGCRSTLTMVGPKKDTLVERWNKKGLPWPENVTLRGRLEPHEWHAMAEEYSLFLNTSYEDSFPITLLQAQQVGLPILSTSVGGIPEMVHSGTHGFLVPAADYQAMAQWIQSLESPSGSAKLAPLSRQSLEKSKEYTWEAISPMWYQVLDAYL